MDDWQRRTLRPIAWLIAGLTLGPGCVRTRAYQREHLARPSMVADRQAGEVRFDQHARGSREGAEGGGGEAGGGCGCN